MGTIYRGANIPPAPRSERELLQWAQRITDFLVRVLGPLAAQIVVRTGSIEVPALGVNTTPPDAGAALKEDEPLILDGS